MSISSLLHLSTWGPYARIIVALIIIAVAGGLCGFIIKSGLDDISINNDQVAINRNGP